MFFSKPKATVNIVNDYDSEVFNLFKVIVDRKEDLANFWNIMPIHEDLWKHWKTTTESDLIRKAARFVLLSNFSFMGQMQMLMLERCNRYTAVQQRIDTVHDQLRGVKFTNCDFRQMLKRIAFGPNDRAKAFIFADPPYLGTKGGNYNSFSPNDTKDLFDVLLASGCRFAISEFDHPYVLQLAREHGLNVIQIGERQNMKNRRMEILVTNY